MIAAGEARHMHRKTGAKVYIRRRDHKPQWFDVWDGLPYILRRPAPGCEVIIHGGGQRPYIDAKTPERWVWKRYTPHPAEFAFTAEELRKAEPYRGMVMVEPNCKPNGHDNKQWIVPRWLELVSGRPDVPWVQCTPGSAPVMLPVKQAHTETFRQAAAVLSVCKAFVGTEGGLMHAAAAVGVPGVILFGGFISNEVTGYKMHRNIFTGTGLGCGMRTNCAHCRKAMQRITVEQVSGELSSLLGQTPRNA